MTENDAAIAAALHAADVDERRRLAEDRALARTLEAAEEGVRTVPPPPPHLPAPSGVAAKE